MKSPINFEARRKNFFSQMAKQAANTVAIIPAHPEMVRNFDVHFKFRQDSNFHYLTGFEEPDTIAVFSNVGGKQEFLLFVRPKDLAKEIWNGYRAGVEGATSKYGANRAYVVDEFETIMLPILQKAERVYYSFLRSQNIHGVEKLDTKILRMMDQARVSMGRTGRGLQPIYDANDILGEMRLTKNAEEISLLRKAGEVSARAHSEAMARCKPGINEFQIEALIEYIFRNEGCDRHGYPSIIASGANATILHYVENNRMMQDGDLLLIDAGGEYGYYTADITRTFPVNGKFTDAQKEIYSIVLDVQKECIKKARPGVTMLELHTFAVEELTKAMIKLKFISGPLEDAIRTQTFKKYYPHGTGHFLGMDVHDAGLYYLDGTPRKLEAGMCFTIEPGFYVLHDDKTVAEKYRGIGVRIEDDVVITDKGCEVLTSGVPKEINDMSAIIGTKKWLSLN